MRLTWKHLILCFLIPQLWKDGVKASALPLEVVPHLIPEGSVVLNLLPTSIWRGPDLASENSVQIWSQAKAVPVSIRPTIGRNLVIMMTSNQVGTELAQDLLLQFSQTYKQVEMVIIQGDPNDDPDTGIQQLYLTGYHWSPTKIIWIRSFLKSSRKHLIRIQCPGDQSFRHTLFVTDGGFSNHQPTDCSTKDVSVSIPLHLWLVGEDRATLELAEIYCQKHGFNLTVSDAESYRWLPERLSNYSASLGNTFVTWPRSEFIIGTSPIFYYEFKFLSGPRHPVIDSQNLLKPFTLPVWLWFLVTIIFAAIAVTLYMRRRNSSEYLWNVLVVTAMSVEEPVEDFKKFTSGWMGKLLLGLFLLCIMTLSKSYKGNILANLVSVELEKKIDTVQDVLAALKAGKKFYFNRGGASTSALMNSPNTDILKMINLGRAIDNDEEDWVNNQVLANKGIAFRATSEKKDPDFELSRDTLYYGGKQLVVPLNFPWFKELNFFAQQMTSSGIVTTMDNPYLRCRNCKVKEFGAKKPVVINMRHFVSPLVLISCCLVGTTIIFVVERLFFLWKGRH